MAKHEREASLQHIEFANQKIRETKSMVAKNTEILDDIQETWEKLSSNLTSFPMDITCTADAIPIVSKDRSLVLLSGAINPPASGVVFANLPEGFRPASTRVFSCDADGATFRVDVEKNGDVKCVTGGARRVVSLSGICFYAAN